MFHKKTMQEKRKILIGMLLGVLYSWGMVFVSLPFIIKKVSFLLGFIACLVFVLLFLLLLIVRERPGFFNTLFSPKKITMELQQDARVFVLLRMLLFIMVLLSGLLGGYVVYTQNEWRLTQAQFQQAQTERETAMLEAQKNSGNVHLMSHLLTKVDEEIKTQPSRKLIAETIARIAALSATFHPYPKVENGGWSKEKYSPERGQLLLALVNMKLDSISFAQIKSQATFAGADLEGANLRGFDLSGINLKEAYLKDADFRKTNLAKADLKGANLWAANFGKAWLAEADLRRTNMQWAELRGAELKGINLEGADLTCAKMTKVNLESAHLSWAILNEAFLNGAHLAGVALSGTAMKRTNFEGADMSGTTLKLADMREANLTNANLSRADCAGAQWSGATLTKANLTETSLYRITVKEANWFEKLIEWQVVGSEDIPKKFKIEKDPYGEANYRLFPADQ
jgi:uncharacterized protein YjbI with pentapeptide repeats